MIHCLLIYDIIRKLVESFKERDVELLHLLLKSKPLHFLPNYYLASLSCSLAHSHRHWHGDQEGRLQISEGPSQYSMECILSPLTVLSRILFSAYSPKLQIQNCPKREISVNNGPSLLIMDSKLL